ncbi:hypothetical protein ACO0LB_17745 [Undibacterium sp. SXout7W]|uniref:hypothetical protein n=1 Tax=Undibacterium sp. SXout7W TaxID=3413049 RepID=UPI003BEF7BB0
MSTNEAEVPTLESLTELQGKAILSFLHVRRSLNQLRVRACLAIILVIGGAAISSHFAVFDSQIFQGVALVLATGLLILSEGLCAYTIRQAKFTLLALALPSDFIHSLANLDIREMDKKLAARKSEQA